MVMEAKKRKVEESLPHELTSEDVQKLIQPFSKDQLLDILRKAALRHLDVLEEVRNVADKDPVHRKLFLRGLGCDTTSDTLHSLFSQFGELEEIVIVVDKNTGKSKGYGFITFKHIDGAQRALKEPSKKIEGRMTVCQLASTGPAPPQTFPNLAARKIYVGNVPMDLATDKLLTLFSKYGEIEEGPLGLDKQTGKSKGFAFFIYKSVESAKRAIEEPVKVIDGHQIHCKLAEGQKQRAVVSQIQSEGVDLATMQTGGTAVAASNVPYGTVNPNALTGTLSNNPALNIAINPGLAHSFSPALIAQGFHAGLPANQNFATVTSSFSPSLAQQLALNSSLGHSLNASLNPSLYSSLPSLLNASFTHGGSHGLTHASSQLPTSLGISNYGLGAYGSQIQALGSQSAHAGLVGASPYSFPTNFVPGHTSVLSGSGVLPNPQFLQSIGSQAQSLPSYLTN